MTRCATRARRTPSRLIDAGVRTTLRRYPGYVHGFINFMQGAGPGPREAVAEMGGVLRAELVGLGLLGLALRGRVLLAVRADP